MPRMPGEKYTQARQAQAREARKKQYKQYDMFERNPKARRFYNSMAWRNTRAAYIQRHPLCEECERQGRIVQAQEIHHIVPIDEGGAPLDHSNLMSLCHACHMALHGVGKQEQYQTEINIVYGPPCSGKSTYVTAHSTPGDLVWDQDVVASVISGLPQHHDAQGILGVVLAMRDGMLKELSSASCKVRRAWVIITRPAELRHRFPNANFYYVDTPEEICVERARERHNAAEIIPAIRRWFEQDYSRLNDRRVGGYKKSEAFR